jgi:hypothetical protein
VLGLLRRRLEELRVKHAVESLEKPGERRDAYEYGRLVGYAQGLAEAIRQVDRAARDEREDPEFR